MSTVLDTIEVTVEHGGEELTLDVEITAWPTRATLEHPGDPGEWRWNWWNGSDKAFCTALGTSPETFEARHTEVINDQVQEHCAERAAPGREG